MIVGRSKDVHGPYLDKENVSMSQGGGSIVLQGNSEWYGVGHNAVVSFGDTDYLVFHAYDAFDEGKPKLRIEKIAWIEGWPSIK